MITDTRVRSLARRDGVTAGLAEKNYVNSWVLYAIYAEAVSESLVFKGGTALNKLYFPEIWRFSEDLDFTASDPVPELAARLEAALAGIESVSGIGFEIRSVHEAGDPVEYVQIKVQYDAVLGQRNTTDLDVTFNEPLVFPVVRHEHRFEDVPQFNLIAYSVEEILVEKLRSHFQRARARDYYDAFRLLEQESFDDEAVAAALREKCEARGVEFDLSQGLPRGDMEEVEAYWEQALDRLVTEQLPFEEVAARIDAYLRHLSKRSTT